MNYGQQTVRVTQYCGVEGKYPNTYLIFFNNPCTTNPIIFTSLLANPRYKKLSLFLV